MSTLNDIFKKIEDKTELSSHKVELGLIQDLEKEFTKIIQSTKSIKDEGTRLGKEIFAFRDVYGVDASRFINLKEDYKKAAKDLGVDVDVKFDKAFEDLNDIKKTYAYLVGR
jgi:predicted  nucleic acid-binding Zn-ribbon protein